MDTTFEVSKTNTLADGLITTTSSMLDETESKTMHNDKEGDRQKKKKTLSEVNKSKTS